ncbi:uncharacterized protein RAG0_05845 [Rhynchosporium agropyri]|uniref:BZIP domain-containing protein n=1 Tax=Rhynchosporium agropyri TaxID=914238 RepID=A0A1E1KIF7_9HELO|nr:uncharacterized protein RAG0_05845 [Rhynchosporium agropyri]
MGSLMTPNTELFYAFVNLEDTPVPCDLPEEDVFARAFRQATVAKPKSKENGFGQYSEQHSAQNSPQDVVFDDFLTKDLDGQGDTSPSSVSSSSTKRFRTPKYNTTFTTQQADRGNQQNFPKSVPAKEIIYQAPQQIIDANQNETSALSQPFSAPATNSTSHPPPNAFHDQPKQPRRRNTKRKLRTEEEEASRRTAFLERNRQAAQKCRSRKKRQTNTLEDDLAVQEEINARLKGQAEELIAELRHLKEVYMQCEQECQHAKVGGEAEKKVEQEDARVGVKKGGDKGAGEEVRESTVSQEPQNELVEAMDVS